MAKRPAAKRDFMQVAREVVEQAIGEQIDGKPLLAPHQTSATFMQSLLGASVEGRGAALGLRS